VTIQVDTGKSRSTVDPELATRIGLARTRLGVSLPQLVLGHVTVTTESAKLVRLAEIDPAVSPPIQIGLGSDTLAGFVLTVDYRGGCLILQPNS
jgi:hypothetical protein